jgi:acyl-ACP thioesterase
VGFATANNTNTDAKIIHITIEIVLIALTILSGPILLSFTASSLKNFFIFIKMEVHSSGRSRKPVGAFYTLLQGLLSRSIVV